MKRKKEQNWLYKDTGNVLSFVVLLILAMTLLVTASMVLAKTQSKGADSVRQTANSYYLARSGAEKLVDTMNKEIARELPSLMDEANKEAKARLLTEGGVRYEFEERDPYSGVYMGILDGNEYKTILRGLIYNHIINKLIPKIETSYYEAFSDVKDNNPINITSRIYYKSDTGLYQGMPDDIKNMVMQLASKSDMLISSTEQNRKDVFVVEVVAQAKEGSKTSLTKSRVVGTVALEQLVEEDHLLEAYSWAKKGDEDRTRRSKALETGLVFFEELNGGLADVSCFQTQQEWTYNNPLLVIEGPREIDISDFSEIPTAIVCINSYPIILKGNGEFKGIIITPGKLKVTNKMTIKGTIIVGDYESCDHVEIKYDEDMLFRINLMDQSLQRRLYDSLKITDYQSALYSDATGQERINLIMGDEKNRMITLSPRSIIHSQKGGLEFVMKSLKKL